MCNNHTLDEAYLAYQQELVEAGLLIPSGVAGVYGRSGVFEGVIDKFEDYVTRMGEQFNPEVMRFPPVFNRQHYLTTDHIETMPDLMGSVHSFCGNERDHHAMATKARDNDDSWTESLKAAEVMMVPAACYPLYPTAANTRLSEEGRLVDLKAFVFRHEPSPDPARMQIFRQREYVRLGTAEQALEHRNYWLQTAEKMLKSVGLTVVKELANDPFFGRGGRVMKATQREQDLKYELTVAICSSEKPTAVVSCNCHLDHFGLAHNITTADGQPAHSACIGFGLERIALALFKTHGFDPVQWPQEVKQVLALT